MLSFLYEVSDLASSTNFIANLNRQAVFHLHESFMNDHYERVSFLSAHAISVSLGHSTIMDHSSGWNEVSLLMDKADDTSYVANTLLANFATRSPILHPEKSSVYINHSESG